jgi:hypothetical protein
LDNIDIEKFKRRGDYVIRLIAIHSAKKGLGDQLQDILVKVIEPTRKSLETHLNQPYITSAVEQMASILAKPVELRIYSEVRR